MGIKMVSGGFLVDKPIGMTARQVDNVIGKLLRTRRVGHIGTLDPIATGLLPVLVGPATRIAPFVDNGKKAYHAKITLGVATDTDDADGKIIETSPVSVQPSRIVSELMSFLGEIEQVPPKYSAKRVGGVPMYKRARRGEDVIMQPKKVVVYSIENIKIDLPSVEFDMVCSTGTYLRAIARDIGIRLSCGAHLSALVRTAVGPHRIESSTKLADIIDAIKRGEMEKYLMSELDLLPHLPRIEVSSSDVWRIRHGQVVNGLGNKIKPMQFFALVDKNENLLAVAQRIPGGYKYKRVLA